MLTIGPVKNVVLIGESGVFPELRRICESNGVNCVVVTSTDQRERAACGAKTVVTDEISSEAFERTFKAHLVEGKTAAISFGARWIMTEDIRRRLFDGVVLNAHGTRLPNDRGGGGFSWRIMRGDRVGNLVLHLVDDGIDTGPVLRHKEYLTPPHVRTPLEHHQYYEDRLREFIAAFLLETFAGEVACLLHRQFEYASTYYPRLHTATHGWIDWSWPAADIERFILAFDEPYPGARTTWRDRTVILRNCQLHVGEIGHHPFQRGLAIRNNGEWLTVALDGEHCLLVASVHDEHGADLIGKIKVGDRLRTDRALLDEAAGVRVAFSASGLKTFGKKPTERQGPGEGGA